MLANMCVEPHLRELPKHRNGANGYTPALIDYVYLAHAVLTTDETVKAMKQAA